MLTRETSKIFQHFFLFFCAKEPFHNYKYLTQNWIWLSLLTTYGLGNVLKMPLEIFEVVVDLFSVYLLSIPKVWYMEISYHQVSVKKIHNPIKGIQFGVKLP